MTPSPFEKSWLVAAAVWPFEGNTFFSSDIQSQKNFGVVTASSSGNYAIALAYQGKSLGIPVTVLLPENTSPVKIRMCEKYNADTVVGGLDEEEVKFLSYFKESSFFNREQCIFER